MSYEIHQPAMRQVFNPVTASLNLVNLVRTYRHTQGVPSAIWMIEHNLGYYPEVVVISSSNEVVEGEITYPDRNTAIIYFSGGFSGEAYCQ